MTTSLARTVYRGDTLFFLDAVYQDLATLQLFTVPVTSPPAPPPANGVPFNLTGARLWFTAKNTYDDPDNQAVIALDNQTLGGVAVLSAIQGTFSVTAPPLATLGFADSSTDLLFDIQIKDATGRIFTIEVGTLRVTPDLTRAAS